MSKEFPSVLPKKPLTSLLKLGSDIEPVEDLIAEESQVVEQVAQERDGAGGHHHHHDQIAQESAQFDSFSAPQAPNNYGAPQPQTDSYGSPQAPPQTDSYGSPQAPVVDSYGSPQGPVQDSYGSPQGPVISNPPPPPPQHTGPIPVPLPLPVNPGSIVIPQGPSYGAPSQPKPQYKPRPRPPKRPYRPPPPPKRRPPPKRPQYKPKPKPTYKAPAKPQYKPKPKPQPPKVQYKPKPKPQYKPKPKPQYKPRPPKPQYKPKPKPQYKPKPKPKPQTYKPPRPSKPQYKPAPKPRKPLYKPKPKPTYQAVAPAPTYNGGNEVESWPKAQPDMPKIVSLDVTCEKNLMKVFVEFDKPFYGIIFSKGHYSDVNCVHLPAGLGRKSAKFDVSINSCGTTGNTENGLYGYGADSGSGTFFENTIVVQYDPQVQEVWDQARKLRCTWHDQYEKSVTFRPFAVDMLDVVRADFAGDNVGCWMQIQVGKGPWASEVSGLVKIGQTMTMVLAIKDDEQKFDMMVRNCMAHDGQRAPIQLVDQKGCVTRPKLMSKFTKIKNFGASASVLSYAHFQAFKFPDSMQVHFQCTIQICRYQCPDQCGSSSSSSGGYKAPVVTSSGGDSYGSPQAPVQTSYNGKRSKRETIEETPAEVTSIEENEDMPATEDVQEEVADQELSDDTIEIDLSDVGVEKVIQVVSSGDLTFAIKEQESDDEYSPVTQSLTSDEQGYICMSTPAFAATLVILLAILVVSCLLSAFLCLRHRSYYGETSLIAAFANPVFAHKKNHF